MPVVTAQQVKEILNIKTTIDTQYSSTLEYLIPIVQEDMCEYLGTYFADGAIYRESVSAFEFVRGNGSADYITDTNADFKTVGFSTASDTGEEFDVAVIGGWSNTGIHHVVELDTAGGTMTLDSTGELVNQDLDDMRHNPGKVRIALVNWPKGLRIAAARMAWHLMDKPTQDDVKSERLDDYSVVFAGEHEYPKRILHGLKKYKKAIMV